MTEPIKETGVKIIRLNTGEDIIANCVLDDETNCVIVGNAMKVVITRVSTFGKTMLVMMPWLPLELIDEDLASINYDDIITIINPKQSFVEYYNNTVEQFQAALELKKEDSENEFDSDEEESDDMDEETIKEFMDKLRARKNTSYH